MKNQYSKFRKGNIVLLSVFLLVVIIAMAALAVETGIMATSKAELQRCADAAAMAAVGEYSTQRNNGALDLIAQAHARTKAVSIVSANKIGGHAPTITENLTNTPGGNVVFGQVDFATGSSSFNPTTTNPNAVKVVVRRTADENGEIPMIFSKILNYGDKSFTGTAIAAIASEIRGFKDPGNGTLNILPFVVKQSRWNDLVLNGIGNDDFSWDETTGSVVSAGDLIPEMNMYPMDTGASGNYGTVDIGSPGNSNADAKRQIEHGVNSNDFSHHGGKLELNSNGEMTLNADTGISSGMQNAFDAAIGRPSVIMVYSSVNEGGNNASYTIVKFVGVRLLDVKLNGNNKRIIVQPTGVEMNSVIPADPTDSVEYSEGIVSPVVLIE